jgi:hypothetical protein
MDYRHLLLAAGALRIVGEVVRHLESGQTRRKPADQGLSWRHELDQAKQFYEICDVFCIGSAGDAAASLMSVGT